MEAPDEKEQILHNKDLIVEGDADWADQLASLFENSGFIVTRLPTVTMSKPGLDILKPDILILYGNAANSVEICRQCVSFHIPVILVGADTVEDMTGKAFEAGAEFYEEMPIRNKRLVARVKAVLRRTAKK